MSEPMQPRQNEVNVWMYRQGLGDCFLPRFPTKERKRPRRMLTDCGSLKGSTGGTIAINEVMEDIRETTQRHLDVLVITHEHWDHLSGFNQATEAFKLKSELSFPFDRNCRIKPGELTKTSDGSKTDLGAFFDKHYGIDHLIARTASHAAASLPPAGASPDEREVRLERRRIDTD